MPVDQQALDSSAIATRWKEPYVSASVNHRGVGILAPGIYRGLKLAEDGGAGDRTVIVEDDADYGDHVAGYETSDGYFIHYRDASAGNITLTLTDYSSQTVVVAIYIEYAIGSDTTGVFRTYTVAEFDALSASARGELVVLGTVVVPASGAIVAASITADRRTSASANRQRGTVQAAPIVRNPSFEFGVSGDAYEHSSLFWRKKSTLGTGTWTTTTATANVGAKSVLLSVASGPFSGELFQSIGAATREGESLICQLFVRQVQTISSGSIEAFVEFADADGRAMTRSTVTLDGGAADGSFREVSFTLTAPATATSIRTLGIQAVSLDPTAPGDVIYIDDFTALIDVEDTRLYNPYDQNWRQPVNVESIVLQQQDDTEWNDNTALIEYDGASPSTEGSVKIGSGSSSLPPALAIFGRILGIGSGLSDSLSNGLKPRIQADAATTYTEYTPMYTMDVAGQGSGRIYSRDDGSLVMTVNARWDGSIWNQDVADDSSRLDLKTSGVEVLLKTSTASWADGAWTSTAVSVGTDATTLTDLIVTSLGGSRISSDVESLQPRLEGPVRALGTEDDYTLIWRFGTPSLKQFRMFVSPTGRMFGTVNAVYDGTDWTKDVNGEEAIALEMSGGATAAATIYIQETGTDTWSDGAWSDTVASFDVGSRYKTIPLFAGRDDGADWGLVVSATAPGIYWSTNTGSGSSLFIPIPVESGEVIESVTAIVDNHIAGTSGAMTLDMEVLQYAHGVTAATVTSFGTDSIVDLADTFAIIASVNLSSHVASAVSNSYYMRLATGAGAAERRVSAAFYKYKKPSWS